MRICHGSAESSTTIPDRILIMSPLSLLKTTFYLTLTSLSAERATLLDTIVTFQDEKRAVWMMWMQM
uniref:ATP binding protein n=1 Tax=Solanum tuberosum TaxID=4113 RepID=M1B8T1_SOLTU